MQPVKSGALTSLSLLGMMSALVGWQATAFADTIKAKSPTTLDGKPYSKPTSKAQTGLACYEWRSAILLRGTAAVLRNKESPALIAKAAMSVERIKGITKCKVAIACETLPPCAR